jgi:hypothetical protein
MVRLRFLPSILATLLCTDLQLHTDLESAAKATLKDNLFSHTRGKHSSTSIAPFQTIQAFLSPIQTSENLYLVMVLILTLDPSRLETLQNYFIPFPRSIK